MTRNSTGKIKLCTWVLKLFQLYDNFEKSATLGFDVGIQYEVLNVISIAVVLQDAYTAVWTKNFLETKDDEGAEIISYVGHFKYAQLEPKFGIGFDLPVAGHISHLGIHIDYNNLWLLLKKDGVSSNPFLELSVGAELVLLDVFAFRLGMRELYPAVGLGLNLQGFKIDFSVHGRELGWERWQSPQLNVGLSITIQV